MNLRERLLSRLVIADPLVTYDRLGRPIIGPCLIWTGYKDPLGYTRIEVDGRKKLVHRLTYELFIGPIENDLDHLCRVPSCASPAHLEEVTRRENILRGDFIEVSRNRYKTHCWQGHEFTVDNTYTAKNGKRRCRTCMRALERRKYSPEKRHLKHLAATARAAARIEGRT